MSLKYSISKLRRALTNLLFWKNIYRTLKHEGFGSFKTKALNFINPINRYVSPHLSYRYITPELTEEIKVTLQTLKTRPLISIIDFKLGAKQKYFCFLVVYRKIRA